MTWANRSRLLICHEHPERFAHGRSFDMSDLNDLLTVAHLSWGIWANRLQLLIWFKRNDKWVISKWANSQPWKKQAIGSFLVSDLSHLLTVALLSWVTWAIHSHRSLKKREWANRSGFLNLQKNVQKIWFYSIFFSKSLQTPFKSWTPKIHPPYCTFMYNVHKILVKYSTH